MRLLISYYLIVWDSVAIQINKILDKRHWYTVTVFVHNKKGRIIHKSMRELGFARKSDSLDSRMIRKHIGDTLFKNKELYGGKLSYSITCYIGYLIKRKDI